MVHIKQLDEGNTVRLFGFSEEYDPSQGHIVCLCLCVFVCVVSAMVWNIEDERIYRGEGNTLEALFVWAVWKFSTENQCIKLHLQDLLVWEIQASHNSGIMLINCNSARFNAMLSLGLQALNQLAIT